jgi:hypothetical protein
MSFIVLAKRIETVNRTDISIMNILDMVKNDKKVHFKFYRKGELYYSTECGFVFPVPTEDTGDGVFNSEDKALGYMRWIRKQVKLIESEKRKNDYKIETIQIADKV